MTGKTTIRLGETWAAIAARTSGTEDEIIAANHARPDHVPDPGTEIEVPGYAGDPAEETDTAEGA